MVWLFQYIILMEYFKTIDFKFLVVMHSFLESYRDFGKVEKARRKRSNIKTPTEYRQSCYEWHQIAYSF